MSAERSLHNHVAAQDVRKRISTTCGGRRHRGYYVLRGGGDLEVVYKGRSKSMILGMLEGYAGEIARNLFRELVCGPQAGPDSQRNASA